jgi:hypothetical protein
VRPDCDQKCAKPPMHGGPCGSCPMGTNPGRTYRFYTGKPVVPFGERGGCLLHHGQRCCLARGHSHDPWCVYLCWW